MSLGDKFSDKYAERTMIGEGSFGIVYKARIRGTENKFHAVKKISSSSKFETETEFLKKISDHENIVSFIEIFDDRDGFYIVLEYCELGDLDAYVKKTKDLSVDTKVLLMYDMANGLDFLHQNDIVHRDIKPGNVLVVQSEKKKRPLCKIADFGEAKIHEFAGQLSDKIYMATTRGTEPYIAPEVFQHHYTSSCDVFSLGVIFYALFSMDKTNTLTPEVDGRCMHELSPDKILTIVERLQTLPTELRMLTLKMLRKDYHERPKCSSVKDTLNTYIGNSDYWT